MTVDGAIIARYVICAFVTFSLIRLNLAGGYYNRIITIIIITILSPLRRPTVKVTRVCYSSPVADFSATTFGPKAETFRPIAFSPSRYMHENRRRGLNYIAAD